MVFRGPEMELLLLQTVQISSNWTSRVPATKGIATEPVSARHPEPSHVSRTVEHRQGIRSEVRFS